MVHPILMPRPGQMTEECVLLVWHKQEGEPVSKGDVLFEIETDKAVIDVEAFDDGVLLKRLVEEGQTVPVNTVCAYVGAPGDAIPDEPPTDLAPAAPTVTPAAPSSTTDGAQPPRGPGETPRPREAVPGRTGPPRISPRASRLAAEAGLDPQALTGTGPEGRISERDVREALRVTGTPSPRGGEEDEAPRPLSRMRRIIAERLTQSWTSTPHFTVTVAVDMTGIMGVREELEARGTNLAVTAFVLAATARSLVELPELNSHTDGISVWPRQRVHLGLAVSLPAGLVVAVIRDADRRTVLDLHERAGALVQAAREGTLAVDDMTGSTFTVTNLGMFHVDEFSAIINPGEAAVLAVSSAVATPVALGDGLTVRPIMKLTLSADHRLVDGETAARFLNAIRLRLEDGAAWRNEALRA